MEFRRVSRFRSFWQRPHNATSLEAQIQEEMEAHVAMAKEHLIAQGVHPEKAEREARSRFGNFDESIQRIHASARQRESRLNRRERFGELLHDMRLSLRMFRRAPVFFLAVVLTLAVGIGANGAVFSVLQSALLQPLPYDSPSELALLWHHYPNQAPAPGKKHAALYRGVLTAPVVLGWREEMSPAIGDVAAILSWRANTAAEFDLLSSERTDRLRGAMVTPNFFSLLGVRAAYGRLFTAADETSDASLLVLSHAVWQRDFGGDAGILGRAVSLSTGRPRERRVYTVIGILPPSVHFTYPDETEAWAMVPWSFLRDFSPRTLAFDAVLRFRPGVTLEAAQLRANGFTTGLLQPGLPPEQQMRIALEPMREWVVGETRPSLLLLGSVAALLLLITCVTVANGLLARVSARHTELAVRAALGAARARLVRQLLTEGAMLSVAGAVVGTALAVAMQPALRALIPGSLPQVGEISFHTPIVLFGIGMAVVTTLMAAVAPAWGGIHGDAASRLSHAGGRLSATRRAARLRQWLVGAQAMLATALLVSATLLLTSFWKLGHVPLGFDADNVLTLETRLLDQKYRDKNEVARVQDALLERVRAIPGVSDVALTSAVPFRGVDYITNYGVVGSDVSKAANSRYVDDGYFSVLRIRLLRGRLLSPADRKGTQPVAVISESFAELLFHGDDPLGRQLIGDVSLNIVGVVADVRYQSRDKDARPSVYLSRAQTPENLICVIVRAQGNTAAISAAMQQAVHQVDADIPAMKTTTLNRIIDDSVANRRFYTVATTAFATLALALTVAGLIVVVGRSVTERRRELAIRSALGATGTRLMQSATGDVMFATLLGVASGASIVYAGAAILSQFLFGITARAPWSYGVGTGAVLVVALLAASVPIVRFRQLSLAAVLKID